MDCILAVKSLETESKAEIENQIRFLSEENADLRQKIRAGKNAETILEENEIRMKELMECYLEIEGEE